MSANESIIIAFEGLDCSFKETNYKSFVDRFSKISDVYARSFPEYEDKDNWAVQGINVWLSGELDRNIISRHPRIPYYIFALERVTYWYGKEHNIDIYNKNDGAVFVFDRYTLSNVLYNDIGPYAFEHEWIPSPDITVWFRMRDWKILADLISNKEGKDKNEEDLAYLHGIWKRSEEIVNNEGIFDGFRSLFGQFIVIECLDDDGNIRSRNDIANEVDSKLLSALYERKNKVE